MARKEEKVKATARKMRDPGLLVINDHRFEQMTSREECNTRNNTKKDDHTSSLMSYSS